MKPAPEDSAPAAAGGVLEWQEQAGVYERASHRPGPGSSFLPTVIYFHGRGQRPLTVTRVAPAFAGARLIAPTGGVQLARGTTWFENQQIGVAEPQSLLEAERRFLAWLAAYLGEATRPWLCGFSNGGAFAAHLLLRHPHRFRGAALLSAPLVAPPHPAGVLAAKPVFYAYGTQDNIVPAAHFELAKTYLTTRSGGDITLHHYASAHEISPPELVDLATWFGRQLPLP